MIRQGQFRKRFEKTKIVITLHNIAYQGHCSRDNIEMMGLPGSWFDSPMRLQDDFGSDLNLLKGGIVFSDFVTTVSPTYAKEILTPEGGRGLHPTLLANIHKLKGILNGIDTSFWNPKCDKYIDHHYFLNEQMPSSIDLAHTLEKKQKNKWQLLDKLGMNKSESKPLLAIISRLVPQKGIELMMHALQKMPQVGAQAILLGTSPDPEIHWKFVQLEQQFAHHPDVRVLLQQEEALAHKLFASSDMFLIPSFFEPCGLTQMIALTYGSIPVVRKTGGLADTVFDVDFSGKPFAETNGFVFEHADIAGVDSALNRAFLCWMRDKERWNALITQAMEADFSWNKSTKEYIGIYNKLHESKPSHL